MTELLDRRQFSALCARLGLSVPSAGAVIAALSGASALAASDSAPPIKFLQGFVVPALGQGSAGLGQGRHPAAIEEEALRLGLSLGMTSIDTSGDYGGGRSEELIGRAVAGQRDLSSSSPRWKPMK